MDEDTFAVLGSLSVMFAPFGFLVVLGVEVVVWLKTGVWPAYTAMNLLWWLPRESLDVSWSWVAAQKVYEYVLFDLSLLWWPVIISAVLWSVIVALLFVLPETTSHVKDD